MLQKLKTYQENVINDPFFSKINQEELADLITKTNAKIPTSTFLKQLDANPAETQMNVVLSSVFKNIADRNMEEAIGFTNQALRAEYGAVRELEKNLAKRYGVFMRQNPKNITDLFAMDALPDIAMGIIR